jgi:hypothetical protein
LADEGFDAGVLADLAEGRVSKALHEVLGVGDADDGQRVLGQNVGGSRSLRLGGGRDY